jgi:hypothetical protein
LNGLRISEALGADIARVAPPPRHLIVSTFIAGAPR